MKRALTIEAVVSEGLLKSVASELQTMKLLPESLVWSTLTGGNEVRVWMIVSAGEEELAALTAQFQQIAGVLRVIRHEVDRMATAEAFTPAFTD